MEYRIISLLVRLFFSLIGLANHYDKMAWLYRYCSHIEQHTELAQYLDVHVYREALLH
ncbi:hypothetical protein ECDEC3B_1262 [Escherichia coli DEC3B]|nr:hypothetical protein ECDEC3B_1262 [Escherichia coli DEC3B]